MVCAFADYVKALRFARTTGLAQARPSTLLVASTGVALEAKAQKPSRPTASIEYRVREFVELWKFRQPHMIIHVEFVHDLKFHTFGIKHVRGLDASLQLCKPFEVALELVDMIVSSRKALHHERYLRIKLDPSCIKKGRSWVQ
jgi:hypothetical protein